MLDNLHASIETRAEGDEPEAGTDDLAEIRTAITGFTSTAESRFTAIDTGLAEMRTRLDRAETVLRRPGAAAATPPAAEVETRAFAGFIRRGREALTADEVRSLRVSDDTAGGFLAPDQFMAELLRNVVQFSRSARSPA